MALIHFMSKDAYSGLQGVICRVMAMHPELASQCPKFEDKRKLKINLNFSGLDIFQTHVKAVCTFLMSRASEFNTTDLCSQHGTPYKPPPIIQVSIAAQEGAPTRGWERCWIVPKVADFDCIRREISLQGLPERLHEVNKYFTNKDDNLKLRC